MIAKVKTTCKECGGSGTVLEVDIVKLRRLREGAGISLRKLAARAGITAPYLSDVERGRRNFTPKLEKLYGRLK